MSMKGIVSMGAIVVLFIFVAAAVLGGGENKVVSTDSRARGSEGEIASAGNDVDHAGLPHVASSVPRQLNYQGHLVNSDDSSAVTDTLEMTFDLYDDPVDGNLLWTETQPSVSVIGGLFNVLLGSFYSLPETLFAGQNLWLQTAVEGQAMMPRKKLASVPYALSAAGGSFALPLSDTTSVSGRAFSIVNDGDGHAICAEALGEGAYAVYGKASNAGGDYFHRNYGGYFISDGQYGRGSYGKASGANGRGVHGDASNDGDVQNYGGYFSAAGERGIGVYGEAAKSGAVENVGVYGKANGDDGRGVYGYVIGDNARAVYGVAEIGDDGVAGYFDARGDNGVGVYAKGGASGYAADLEGDVNVHGGRVITPILEITGGSDLSERFNISAFEKDVTPSPGMLVSIDPGRPGDLIVSNKAYDRRVVGVVSGAAGLRTGMIMGQEGTQAKGAYPVALTGRVYCWADASTGPIEPGDLLTTSDVPGHAMRVADHDKAQGAVIGKAMSSLEEGCGLLLVLVTLQ